MNGHKFCSFSAKLFLLHHARTLQIRKGSQNIRVVCVIKLTGICKYVLVKKHYSFANLATLLLALLNQYCEIQVKFPVNISTRNAMDKLKASRNCHNFDNGSLYSFKILSF